MNPYRERDRHVAALGFGSYAGYLRSRVWRDIRARVLAAACGRCRRCGRRAEHVHHGAYDAATMRGESLGALVAACRSCHRAAEHRASRVRQSAADRLSVATVYLLTPVSVQHAGAAKQQRRQRARRRKRAAARATARRLTRELDAGWRALVERS